MKIKKYFTTNHIIEGFFIAICLSSFIYIEHFKLLDGYFLQALNSFLGVFGLYRLIKANTPTWFFVGFFIGVFWFWWMGVSFNYYNLPYLVVPVVILIGIFIGLVFLFAAYIASFLSKIVESKFSMIDYKFTIYIFRAFAILIPSFFELFGFNWLKLQLVFIDSFFGVELWQFILIILILAIYATSKKWFILLLLLLSIDFKKPKIFTPDKLKDIELVTTNVNVKEKWLAKNREKYTNMVLAKIDDAIKKNKKLIILPESVLPYFLNLETFYLDDLLKRSKDITIIVGALYYKDKDNFRNSAFIIKNGDYKIANKVVLVPFGEANPLPSFMSKFVNKIFFDGAVDYKADKNFTYIKALDKKYKIAICYEGTSAKTYEDNPEYLIVISNDGWFEPSIEPTLQMLLMKYFSKLHNTTIYHSINGSKSYIIMPFNE
jgi:apolipoprotein N-acyltransferase